LTGNGTVEGVGTKQTLGLQCSTGRGVVGAGFARNGEDVSTRAVVAFEARQTVSHRKVGAVLAFFTCQASPLLSHSVVGAWRARLLDDVSGLAVVTDGARVPIIGFDVRRIGPNRTLQANVTSVTVVEIQVDEVLSSGNSSSCSSIPISSNKRRVRALESCVESVSGP